MIEVEETSGGLRAVDVAKNEVRIGVDDWESGGREHRIDRRTHTSIAGYASELRVPDIGAAVQSYRSDEFHTLFELGSIDFPPDHHLVQLDRGITAFVSVGGTSITCENTADAVYIRFPERTPVTLAFRSFIDLPEETLTVPSSPRGLAAALTRIGRSPWTDTPDRSYPSMRGHPPLVRVDEDAEAIEGDGTEDVDPAEEGVRLRVPQAYEPLFVISPLAYYLGAGVVVEDRRAVTLETDHVSRTVGADSSLPADTAALLRRVFSLDCLVRSAGSFDVEIEENHLLDPYSLDPSEVYDLPIPDRLERYLDFPFEEIADDLPRWPLITYVDPVPTNVPTIPYLLDRFSLVAPPDPRTVDTDEFITRSLSDFHRSSASVEPESAAGDGELVSAQSELADVRAWIADGRPIDAYKATLMSFENRLDAFDRADGPVSISVVLADQAMARERSAVVDVYRDPDNDLPIEVSVSERPSRDELLDVFAGEDDFVHYIGHCDPAGLRCRDGTASLRELSESRVQTFFLNACGSYEEGLTLIRKGAVSGAVTFGDVIDDQARKVGETFARLLMSGFNTAAALSIARNRAILNRQYSVVGDGSHVLSQCTHLMKVTYVASRLAESAFSLSAERHTPKYHGSVFCPSAYADLGLYGSDGTHTLSASEFDRVLAAIEVPVFYEGSFYWPEALRRDLF